jgi:hypothetical protein
MDLSRELTREGVRGGREQFKWESLKSMPLKEREHYLGSIAHVGVPSRFGQSSTNDWWRKGRVDNIPSTSLADEKATIKEMEDQLMREALGLKPKRLMLARDNLTSDQVSEILKKEDNQSSGPSETQSKPSYTDPVRGEDADSSDILRVQGFGYRKNLKQSDWVDGANTEDDVIELKGEGTTTVPMGPMFEVKQEDTVPIRINTRDRPNQVQSPSRHSHREERVYRSYRGYSRDGHIRSSRDRSRSKSRERSLRSREYSPRHSRDVRRDRDSSSHRRNDSNHRKNNHTDFYSRNHKHESKFHSRYSRCCS